METAIPDVKLVKPRKLEDERGWFSEIFSKATTESLGWPDFVQENESMSLHAGTVRGLHFQRQPFVQAKLVRCVSGAIIDVAVDIRPESLTYGCHVALHISSEEREMIYVPAGFAHGFCTLEPETIVQYKVSAPYNLASEGGIAWDDPALGIAWPVTRADVILSDRDRRHPSFAELSA